jgi:hypothetical protein
VGTGSPLATDIQPHHHAQTLEQGLSDTQTTLLAWPWLARMPPEVGARTFDVLKDLHPEPVLALQNPSVESPDR